MRELRITIDLAVPLSERPKEMAETVMKYEGMVVDLKKQLGESARCDHDTKIVTPRPRDKKPAPPGPLLVAMGATEEPAAPDPAPTQESDPLDIPDFLRRTAASA